MTAVRGIVQKQSTFETKVVHFLVHLMFPASSKFMKLKFSIFRGVLVIQKNNLFDVTIGSPYVQTFLLSNFRPQNFIWAQRFWQLDFWTPTYVFQWIVNEGTLQIICTQLMVRFHLFPCFWKTLKSLRATEAITIIIMIIILQYLLCFLWIGNSNSFHYKWNK